MTDPNNINNLPNTPIYGSSQQGMGMYGSYVQPAGFPKPRVKVEFTRAELIFSFIAFALAFIFLRFAVCNAMGFITTAVFVLIITAAIVFMKISGSKFDARTRLVAVLLYLFSTVFSITANEFIKFLDAVFLMLAGVYFLYLLGGESRRFPRFLPLVMVQAALSYPFSHFGKEAEAVAQSAKKTKFGKNIGFIIVGLIVAVPLTLIVGTLLISADKGIERMLGGITDFLSSREMGELVVQLIFAVPLSCYLFGLFYSNAHRSKEKDVNDAYCESRLARSRMVQNIAVYAAVTPICFLYLLFFISQANYLMSAFSGELPEGYSYAEYARKGFFELLAIVIINLAVIAVINLIAKSGGENKPIALKIYSIAICFFTLVIIASALSKMVMYISVYGLTQLRLYTGWFMILCTFIFVMIIIKQARFKFPIAKGITVVFTLMFAVLCFSRPDAVIAKYNTEMSRSGKLEYYDQSYLLTLSDDAVLVYLEEGYADENESDSYSEYMLNSLKADYAEDRYKLMNISSMMVNEILGD